jgi:hypothetical protein
MAQTYRIDLKSKLISDMRCEITLTRSNGVTETVCNPKLTRLSDAVFARVVAENKKTGTVVHGYKNVDAVFENTEIAVPISNGDMLDEIDAIVAKAHKTSIMTLEMSKRLNTLKKAVK